MNMKKSSRGEAATKTELVVLVVVIEYETIEDENEHDNLCAACGDFDRHD